MAHTKMNTTKIVQGIQMVGERELEPAFANSVFLTSNYSIDQLGEDQIRIVVPCGRGLGQRH